MDVLIIKYKWCKLKTIDHIAVHFIMGMSIIIIYIIIIIIILIITIIIIIIIITMFYGLCYQVWRSAVLSR